MCAWLFFCVHDVIWMLYCQIFVQPIAQVGITNIQRCFFQDNEQNLLDIESFQIRMCKYFFQDSEEKLFVIEGFQISMCKY